MSAEDYPLLTTAVQHGVHVKDLVVVEKEMMPGPVIPFLEPVENIQENQGHTETDERMEITKEDDMVEKSDKSIKDEEEKVSNMSTEIDEKANEEKDKNIESKIDNEKDKDIADNIRHVKKDNAEKVVMEEEEKVEEMTDKFESIEIEKIPKPRLRRQTAIPIIVDDVYAVDDRDLLPPTTSSLTLPYQTGEMGKMVQSSMELSGSVQSSDYENMSQTQRSVLYL